MGTIFLLVIVAFVAGIMELLAEHVQRMRQAYLVNYRRGTAYRMFCEGRYCK